MSVNWEPVIGDTEADQVNKTETLQIQAAFTDENGAAINISSASIIVLESYPASIITDMDIDITNGPGGIAILTLTPAQLSKLGLGKVNWFRLQVSYSVDSVDTTPKTWIKIT